MMDEDVEFVEAPDGQVFMLQDRVSARVMAYATIVELAQTVKDPEILSDVLEMLKAIRLSITAKEPMISAIKGGKP